VINAEIADGQLKITVTRGDAWLLALRPHWSESVPLSGVRQAAARGSLGLFTRRHVVERRDDRLRLRGRLLCARRWARTLHIDLDDGPFRVIILSVSDPAATAAAIQDAIAGRCRGLSADQ
jgi:hypothetical protein